jgi:Cu-Zn family superoxide dismutase
MLHRPRLLAASVLVALAGCSHLQRPANPGAVATLVPTRGNTVSGQLRFTQAGDRLVVSGLVQGLKPNAEHGFHVHETGDCTSPDGMRAGDHFNPGRQPHGRFDAPAHHAGDLPSVRADASGNAIVNFETRALRVGSGDTDVVGRALIVHRDRDDLRSQPAGNSGPRVACAVIVRTQPGRP